MERTYKVPQELWDKWLKLTSEDSERKTSIRETWEAMAKSVGVIPPSMAIVSDKGEVMGEPVPNPAVMKDKHLLMVIDVLRDLDEEDRSLVVNKAMGDPPARKLAAQVDKLYDGWTLEAAYSEAGPDALGIPVFEGKVLEALEGDADETDE